MSVRNLEDEIKEMLGKNKKEEPAPVEEQKEEVLASTTAFVNDKPLIPTAELEEDKSAKLFVETLNVKLRSSEIILLLLWIHYRLLSRSIVC